MWEQCGGSVVRAVASQQERCWFTLLFLSDICMFSPCTCVFSLGTPVSVLDQKCAFRLISNFKRTLGVNTGLFAVEGPLCVQNWTQHVCISHYGAIPPRLLKLQELWFSTGRPAWPDLTSAPVAHWLVHWSGCHIRHIRFILHELFPVTYNISDKLSWTTAAKQQPNNIG